MKKWIFGLFIVLLLPLFLVAEEHPLFFNKQKIKIGKKTLIVEVADSPERQARGLMYRKKLEKNQGMIFIMDGEIVRSFWMKNTFVPLSIGFFDSKRTLVDIQDMEPVKSEMEKPKTYQSRAPAKFVLEVPVGWFRENKIKIGDRFHFIQ